MSWHYNLAKRKANGEVLWGIVELYSGGGYTDSIIGWWGSKSDVIDTLKMMLNDVDEYKYIDYKEDK